MVLHKIKIILHKVLFTPIAVIAIVSIFSSAGARADVVDDNIDYLLDNFIDNPKPDPESVDPYFTESSRAWGRAGYALAALTQNRSQAEVDQANKYIQLLAEETPIKPGNKFESYFKLPLLWRIYLTPSTNALLEQQSKDDIEGMMWDFIKDRSSVADAEIGSTWYLHDSENHDTMQKSNFMLASEALINAGAPYGPSATLDDGRSLEDHRNAWQKYYFEYFRTRAREGLNMEVSSPTYAKYSLATYNNIYDLSSSAPLRALAGDFLTLSWADVAIEYQNIAGLRGGAHMRHYKKDIPRTIDPYTPILYAYDWSDTNASMSPAHLPILTSAYRPPAIVNSIGKDLDKPQSANALLNTSENGFLYHSRRWGRGDNDVHVATFANDNAANIRHDSYIHRDYIVGGTTFDTGETFNINASSQNRSMGIYFNSAARNERIIFHGEGRSTNDKGYLEITGAVGENTLVAAKATNNFSSGDGTRIFLTEDTLLANREDDSGWIFTKTDVINTLLPGDINTPITAATIPTYIRDGYVNQALEFDGTDDIAYAETAWESYDSVAVEFSFKTETTTTANQVLVNAISTWQVSLSYDDLKFVIWTDNEPRTLTLDNAVTAGTWYTVSANVDALGNMNVTLSDGVSEVTNSSLGDVLKQQNKPITLGEKPGTNRFFNGALDSVVISVPSSTALVANWPMEQTEEVFVGIYIADGLYTIEDYQVVSTVQGEEVIKHYDLIQLDDNWSPVVFQVGAAADYGYDYSAFKTSVKENSVSYSSGKLTYTSEAGDTFEMWSNSVNLPTINGSEVDLNPNKTYDSPFLQGYHGLNEVTLSYPGHNDLKLDFSYSAAPQQDDYQTVALWHMDTLTADKVLDDTRGNVALDVTAQRNAADLTLIGGTALTTADGGKFGEALSFDGINDMAEVVDGWDSSNKTVRVEAWIYPTDTAGSNVVVAADGVWKVTIGNGNLQFSTWDSSQTPTTLTWPTSLNENTWYHVVASCLEDGTMQLSVDRGAPEQATVTGLRSLTQDIDLGEKPGKNRWYNGLIDDLKISRPYIK